MTAAGTIVLLAGPFLAPLVPGIVQSLKARLQGRRGPSLIQSYRELARLWSRTPVDPEGATAVYRLAPPIVAACLLLACVMLPLPDALRTPLGSDALVLIGLLSLARFAISIAAWDTGGGFSLMGAARDLMLAPFVEALLLLAIVAAAIAAGSTDLRAIATAGAAPSVWATPVRWAGAAAMALVVLAETGRQPVDNPDTHLELTMIHEGPLLEYAGRDLAYLQWAAAARHWLFLVLAAELFLPQPAAGWARLIELAVALPAGAVALALVETWQAKMRILVVPRLLGAGAVVAVAGYAGWLVLPR